MSPCTDGHQGREYVFLKGEDQADHVSFEQSRGSGGERKQLCSQSEDVHSTAEAQAFL